MPYAKQIPQWNATGTKPPQSLIDNGWQFNQKPPADYFNWQWNSVYQVLNELHQFALHSEKLGASSGIATLGSDGKLTAAQLPAIGSAQITDGSITNNNLATDVKVGSLATLTTTAKTSVTAAVNEVKASADAKIPLTQRAAANGVATLDATTKIPISQIPLIPTANITDASVTDAKFGIDVKVGSLASLVTTAKGSVVAAINEVDTDLINHTNDAVRHVTVSDKNAWNAKAETTVATTSANGLMSFGDKTKLDGIASGAQPNQNAFSNVKVGTTTVVADSATDTLELIAGTNITLTPNTTNDTVTITNSTPDATTTVSGLMSSADKTKLDGVAANANNYTHPSTHPASIIVQDASNRFVTDAEKAAWNAKASTAVVTTSSNGLMSSSDKTKLEGVAANANNYSHPIGDGNLHVPATGTTNGGKFLEAGSTAGSLLWTNIDWTDIFNKPTTFTPSAHVHAIADVTGLQAALDGKSSASHTHANATTSVAGFMAAADKAKLDGISTGANRITNPATNGVIAIDGVNTTVYAHPTGDGNLHVPATSTTNNGKFLKAGSTAGSISWQSAAISDVTGLQTELNGKSDTGHGHSVATTSSNGFMASTDKAKLDGIAAGAQTNQNAFSNVKVGATTIAADLATDTLELIAGTNISLSPNATNDSVTITNSTPTATSSVAGLMSASDKGKLDGVAPGANNYIHPSTHPATMITEDSGHRFITDAERTKWDASQLAKLTEVNGDAKSMPNTNADLVIDAGNYNTNSTHINTPANETNGTLIVVPRGSSETQSHTQFFLSSASGKVYHRIRTSGTWGSWRQFTTNDVTWYNFSFTGGASGFGSGNSYGVKGDGRVYFEAVVTLPNGLSSGTVIATLVAAARPSKTTYIPISTPNGQTLQFFVNTAGQLTLNTATTSAANVTLYGSFALEPNR